MVSKWKGEIGFNGVKLEIALVIEDGIEEYLHNAEVDGDMDCDPGPFNSSGWVELKHRLDGQSLDRDTFKRVYIYIYESVQYVQNSGAKPESS